MLEIKKRYLVNELPDLSACKKRWTRSHTFSGGTKCGRNQMNTQNADLLPGLKAGALTPEIAPERERKKEKSTEQLISFKPHVFSHA